MRVRRLVLGLGLTAGTFAGGRAGDLGEPLAAVVGSYQPLGGDAPGGSSYRFFPDSRVEEALRIRQVGADPEGFAILPGGLTWSEGRYELRQVKRAPGDRDGYSGFLFLDHRGRGWSIPFWRSSSGSFSAWGLLHESGLLVVPNTPGGGLERGGFLFRLDDRGMTRLAVAGKSIDALDERLRWKLRTRGWLAPQDMIATWIPTRLGKAGWFGSPADEVEFRVGFVPPATSRQADLKVDFFRVVTQVKGGRLVVSDSGDWED